MKQLAFIMPFFMLGGTAWQGSGFYITAICLLLLTRSLSYANPLTLGRSIKLMALALGGLYLLFPLANLLNSLLPPGDTISSLSRPQGLALKSLLSSHFSSALLATSFFLFLFYKLQKRSGSSSATAHRTSPAEVKDNTKAPTLFSCKKEEASSSFFTHDPIVMAFTKGMAIATTLLAAYIVFQHLTGFDYKEASLQLASSKRLASSGHYRVLGFFSHPLSLAGASLCLFSFFAYLFRETLPSTLKRLSLSSFPLTQALFFYIATLHFLFIALSGSRFATVSASFMMFFIALSMPLQALGKKSKIFWLTAILVLVFIGLHFSGILSRFQELGELTHPSIQNRLQFWRVHWRIFLDKPWVGHGHAWLNAFARQGYYEHLGLSEFSQKYNAHNIFLEILANVGLLGGIGIVSCAYVFFRSLRQLAVNRKREALYVAFSAALFANLINGFTQNTLFDSNVFYIYLFLLWLILASVVASKEQPAKVDIHKEGCY